MNTVFVISLGFSALIVSVTGAFFSISGLMKLFSGAPVAVMIMASALELAKVMAATFLHRNWGKMHVIMRVYLSCAVGILMTITSLGIFGYLSFAYQNTSRELKNTMTQIKFLEGEENKLQIEKDRLQKTIDEIPLSRVTRRLDLQKDLEPAFRDLNRQSLEVQLKLRNENLKKLSYQAEIGPVIFVAEFMNLPTENVATWLIVLFVIVFDPLAVCMVLATSFAANQGREPEAAPVLEKRPAA